MCCNNNSVDILLSCYNGERFVADQINSIKRQTHQYWRLIIRDDLSTDSTLDVIHKLAAEDSRIVILNTDIVNLGPALSFVSLLKHVTAPFFMFCDQDDIWEPNKIEEYLCILTNSDVPHLVFSDLSVVDEKLNVIAISFMRLARFDPVIGVTLPKLLMQNVVAGCTIAGNKALLDKSSLASSVPPDKMIMHDWWIVLVACVFGKITFINKSTVLYRQHGANCLGSQQTGVWYYIKKLHSERPWIKAQRYLKDISMQAECFAKYYDTLLQTEQKEVIGRLIDVKNKKTIPSLFLCFYYGISMHTIIRNVALTFSFVFGKNKKVWDHKKYETSS